MIFGLPFLKFEEVYESFVFDINLDQETPDDPRVDRFLQYLLTTYMTSGSTFPPHLWASDDLERKRTTNGCEAFHRVFYSYASHYPSSTPSSPHTSYPCPYPTSTLLLLTLPYQHSFPYLHFHPTPTPILPLLLPYSTSTPIPLLTLTTLLPLLQPNLTSTPTPLLNPTTAPYFLCLIELFILRMYNSSVVRFLLFYQLFKCYIRNLNTSRMLIYSTYAI